MIALMSGDDKDELSEAKFEKWMENAALPKTFEESYNG